MVAWCRDLRDEIAEIGADARRLWVDEDGGVEHYYRGASSEGLEFLRPRRRPSAIMTGGPETSIAASRDGCEPATAVSGGVRRRAGSRRIFIHLAC